MAGAVTITEQIYSGVNLITFSWTSDASGDATGTTTSYYDGEVLAFATIPATGSGESPSDNYDIVITDANGLDVLAGQGANRDEATTEYVTNQANLGCVANSQLSIAVSNSGNVTGGVAYLWIR